MRLRMVNLQYVIKNYKRTETLRAEHMELFKRHDGEIQQLKKTLEGRQEQLQKPEFTADQKQAIEREIKRLQREVADKTEEARAALAKKEGEVITLIYKEVDDAVTRYAREQGLELVLHYNDAVADSDRFSAANIARKMSAGACMPMYLTPGLDISEDIVKALNARYPGTAAAPEKPPRGG
jgi:Skp family chaperone for outer membrane proteins